MDLKEYISAAAELELGGELFIPCSNRRQRKKLLTKVLNLADEFTTHVNFDVSFDIAATFKDGRYWIRIERIPLDRAFFTKDQDGVKKIVADDPELRRMIKLMRQDNLTEEEIKEHVKKYNS